jgi:asparagine synthase (glutamine-hydrolysing)
MCGILGCFINNPVANADAYQQGMQLGLEALRHRGPNDRGLEQVALASGQVLLGHTRLSIIDLTSAGRQPMHSPEGRYSIIFNGEIYNYQELRRELSRSGSVFHTHTDTEVLLAAWARWQTDALPKLVGMFAFAVIDRADQTLTLVRDAFGIKPLFYSFTAESLVFSSELPALTKLLPKPPALNLRRGHEYVVYGEYDNGEDTFLENVFQLSPGHSLKLDLARFPTRQKQRWWWPSIEPRSQLNFADAAECLQEMFLNSVRLHLRSDVPLGAALSGGVDSSAVVCAMRRLEPDLPIHTFTFVAKGSSVNEESWADLVNQYVGAISHKVIVEPDELGSDLDDLIWSQGEPFGSTSIYAQYRVFRLASENGITVTLDGQGADEMFAGYNGYPGGMIGSLLNQRRFLSIPKFLNAWSKWPGRSRQAALKILAGQLVPSRYHRFLKRSSLGGHRSPDYIKKSWSKETLETDLESLNTPEPSLGSDVHGRRLMEQLRNALCGRGLAALLRHGDRNSMRWSIESRVPFLTTEMAEFVLSLPESYLVSPTGETKSIFRAAMRGIVPDQVLDRRDKIGFETPEQDWLRDERLAVKQWLEYAKQIPFLDQGRLQSAVDEMGHRAGFFDSKFWRLINYCRWGQLQSAAPSTAFVS